MKIARLAWRVDPSELSDGGFESRPIYVNRNIVIVFLALFIIVMAACGAMTWAGIHVITYP